MSPLLLIDGNAFLFSSQFKYARLSHGSPVHALDGFLEKLAALLSRYPDSAVMVLWDGTAHFRFKLHPGYKSDRRDTELQKKARSEITIQRPWMEKLLVDLAIPQLVCGNLEADDLAYQISRPRVLDALGVTARFSSVDSDWWQFIDHEGVSWEDPIRPAKSVTFSQFEQITGFSSARAYLEAKILTGDRADAIEGIRGVGPVAAKALLKHCNGLAAVKECLRLASFSSDASLQAFARKAPALLDPNAYALVLRNERIMDLSLAPAPSAVATTLRQSKAPRIDEDFLKFKGLSIQTVLSISKALNRERSEKLSQHVMSLILTS